MKDVTGDGIGELIMRIGSFNDGDSKCSIVVWGGFRGEPEAIFEIPVFDYIMHDWGWLYINRVTFGKDTVDMRGIDYKPVKDQGDQLFEKGSIYSNDEELLSLSDLPDYGAVCVEMVEQFYKWDKESGKFLRTKYAQSPVYAAVTGSSVNMRDQCGMEGKVVDKLNKGDRLKVIRIGEYPSKIYGIEAHWAYAETAAGKRGWVFSHYLKYEKQVCQHKYTSHGSFDLKGEQVEFR